MIHRLLIGITKGIILLPFYLVSPRYCLSIVTIVLVAGCVNSPPLPAPDPIWSIDLSSLLTTQGPTSYQKMEVDGLGNTYLAGSLATTTITPTDLEIHDFILTKVDANGQLEWNTPLFQTITSGHIFSEEHQGLLYLIGQFGWITSLLVDSTGNIYVLAPIVANPNIADIDWYIGKFDNQGTLLWNRTLNSPGQDSPIGMILGDNNQLYIYGNNNSDTASTLDVASYDANGNELWKNSIALVSVTGAQNPFGSSQGMSATLNGGNLYLLYRNFNDDLVTTPVYVDILANYDLTGNLIWEKQEPDSIINFTKLWTDQSGNIYSAKLFGNEKLKKRSADGTLLWKRDLPSIHYTLANETGETIALAGNGLFKYDTNGQITAQTTLDIVNGPSRLTRLARDSANRVYVHSIYVECPTFNCSLPYLFPSLWPAKQTPEFLSKLTVFDETLTELKTVQTPIISSSLEYFLFGKPVFYGYGLENVYGSIFYGSPNFDGQGSVFIGNYEQLGKWDINTILTAK